MADKYLKPSSNILAQVSGVATSSGAGDSGKLAALDTTGKISDSIMMREVVTTSTGAPDTGKFIVLDGTGKIPATAYPALAGDVTKAIVAAVGLSANKLVNIYNDSGTLKVRFADASLGRPADGYVLSSFNPGDLAIVYVEGNIGGVDQYSRGVKVYLGTNGDYTYTAPTTPGHILQVIGWSCISSVMYEPQMAIQLA